LKTSIIDQLHRGVKGKEHIIWDWNGTLLADVDYAVSVVNSILVEHELPLVDKMKYRQEFDFPVLKYYEALGFDFSKESFESLCHRFVERFMSGVRELPLYPEMKSVLQQLHIEGVTQSVLSATDQENLSSMVEHFNLKDIFKHVFGINNKFAGSKVDRGHELISVSKIPLEKTIIIGDTLHDLEVAKALGIDAVLISHGHQSTSRLQAKHKMVIEV
jgi:phosphoglycolate phosphatase